MSGRRLLRVALTGGIATGKSHVLARLAAAGVPTIDADRLAREAVRVGAPALERIRGRFGPDVIARDGTLDRRALADLVFGDAGARADLEAILHPEVYRAIREWFVGLEERGEAVLAVADIPLLFETGHAGDFDRVVATVCTPEEQVRRLQRRDGVTEHEARRRLAAQWAAADKARGAHLVIDTNGSIPETDRQVDEVLRQLQTVIPAAEGSR